MDTKDGKGKHYYPDGSTYTGDFKNDKKNGKGMFRHSWKITY